MNPELPLKLCRQRSASARSTSSALPFSADSKSCSEESRSSSASSMYLACISGVILIAGKLGPSSTSGSGSEGTTSATTGASTSAMTSGWAGALPGFSLASMETCNRPTNSSTSTVKVSSLPDSTKSAMVLRKRSMVCSSRVTSGPSRRACSLRKISSRFSALCVNLTMQFNSRKPALPFME